MFSECLAQIRSAATELEVAPKLRVMTLREKLKVEENLDQLKETIAKELAGKVRSITHEGGDVVETDAFIGETLVRKDIVMVQLEPVHEGGLVRQYTFEIEIIWEGDQLVWTVKLSSEVPTYELLGDYVGIENEMILGEKLADLYVYLLAEVTEEEEE